MKRRKERCDHCGKWVRECDLIRPTEEDDGGLGVCEKCISKYPKEYWIEWQKAKLSKTHI